MGKTLLSRLGNLGGKLAIAGSLVAGNANAAPPIEITSHSAIIRDANYSASPPNPLKRAVYFPLDNISHNGHPPENKVIGIYMKWEPTLTTPAYVLAGGFTVEAGQTSSTNSYFNARVNGWKGLDSGQAPTNGLNGASFWHFAMDRNNNGRVGTYNSGAFSFEPNEYLGTSTNLPNTYVSTELSEVPAFPASGTGPVHIASLNIRGMIDLDGDKIDDKWETDKLPPNYSAGSGLTAGDPNCTDFDGDGHPDALEYLFDTDPASTNSVPLGLNVTISGAQVSIPTMRDRKYTVYDCAGLESPQNWAPIPGYENVWGTGQPIILTLPPNKEKCFIRASVQGPNSP